jgi:hypothetical protein
MSAYRIGLLLALGVGVNLAWGENTGAAPSANPIGKVLTATGQSGSIIRLRLRFRPICPQLALARPRSAIWSI